MLEPISSAEWNYARAAHLLNRAGFGGTPAEIESMVQAGPEKAVDSLLRFEPPPAPDTEWARPDEARFRRYKEYREADAQKKQEIRRMEQRAERERMEELRYWWLQRMASGEHPLQEKLTLFWHGHFATSAQKVKSAYLMWRQNDIFRRHGAGNWLTLLTEVSKDPAMLIWLDQAQSRKQQPNENFAREVMELFALGEGHYTEKDIGEAARAFTGWTYDRLNQEFVYRERQHDDGHKTFLGRTGKFGGDDVLKIIVGQPQAARFITRKLWVFFASENPPEKLVAALAEKFRKSGNNFGPVLRAMFLSREFYAPEVVRQQVKSPVQWLIGSVRLLEREMPPARMASQALRTLGQDLLMPPNVKGWDGGLSWITTNNLLNRYNFANYLVLGENPMAMPPKISRNRKRRNVPEGTRAQVAKLFKAEWLDDKEKLASEIQRRLIQAPLKAEHQSTLKAYLDSQGEIDELDVLHALRLVMSTPEYQLC